MKARAVELLAIGAVVLSLLYIPTHICYGQSSQECVPTKWFWLWDLSAAVDQSVDYGRLLLQVLVVVGVGFAGWRYVAAGELAERRRDDQGQAGQQGRGLGSVPRDDQQ